MKELLSKVISFLIAIVFIFGVRWKSDDMGQKSVFLILSERKSLKLCKKYWLMWENMLMFGSNWVK